MELLPFKEARYVLKHYGLRHQKAKAIEELAELIVALQKDLLSGKDGLSKEVIVNLVRLKRATGKAKKGVNK